METKLEQIAVKAVNQLPKSVVREIRTPRSVGAGGGRPPPATRWDGKRGVAEWLKLPRPSSTLPKRSCAGSKSRRAALSCQIEVCYDPVRSLDAEQRPASLFLNPECSTIPSSCKN